MKRKIKEVLVCLYLFYIIYYPNFSKLWLGIENYYLNFILLMIIGSTFLLKVLLDRKKIKKNLRIKILIGGIFLSSMYILLIASITDNDLRILQNNYIIVQILHLIIINSFMNKLHFSLKKKIGLLYIFAFIQSIIALIMLFIPSFRRIALDLYYLGRPENVFINSKRIYGISGEYTFFTPAYHGLLASTALVLNYIDKNMNFFKYLPFILLIILLNGRIGIIIFLASFLVIVLLIILSGRRVLKILKLLIISFLGFIFVMYMINIFNNKTYNWIINGFDSIFSFILKNESKGNMNALGGTMLYVPDNIGIIFGKGYRVFGKFGRAHGYHDSDIGYINDLFLGGIIYISILYGSVIYYIFEKNNLVKYMKGEKFYNFLININFLLCLLISNLKGESMRGGGILIGIIYLKIILTSYSSSKLIRRKYFE